MICSHFTVMNLLNTLTSMSSSSGSAWGLAFFEANTLWVKMLTMMILIHHGYDKEVKHEKEKDDDNTL